MEQISEFPIYLTRGGHVNETSGSLRLAGSLGRYWSSTAYLSELYAYGLHFDSAIVYPSNNGDHYLGFTVGYRK